MSEVETNETLREQLMAELAKNADLLDEVERIAKAHTAEIKAVAARAKTEGYRQALEQVGKVMEHHAGDRGADRFAYGYVIGRLAQIKLNNE